MNGKPLRRNEMTIEMIADETNIPQHQVRTAIRNTRLAGKSKCRLGHKRIIVLRSVVELWMRDGHHTEPDPNNPDARFYSPDHKSKAKADGTGGPASKKAATNLESVIPAEETRRGRSESRNDAAPPPGRIFDVDEATRYVNLSRKEFDEQLAAHRIAPYTDGKFHISDLTRFVLENGGAFRYEITALFESTNQRHTIGWEINGCDDIYYGFEDSSEYCEKVTDREDPEVVWP